VSPNPPVPMVKVTGSGSIVPSKKSLTVAHVISWHVRGRLFVFIPDWV
jgi:hypothetical protein